jgi:uncharacterized protein
LRGKLEYIFLGESMKKLCLLLSSVMLLMLLSSCITVDKLNKASLKELQEMSKESSFVDYTTSDGTNPLMIMVRNDNEANTEYLLSNHFFDVNYANTNGDNALSFAITNDNTTIIQMLIDAGAKVEQSAFSKKPLVIAVKKNKAKSVQVLIQNGADSTVADVDNNGLLHLAASIKNGLETVRALLNNNVSFQTKNLNGETPLFVAFNKDNKLVAQELIGRGASVLSTDSSGNTLYHVLVQNNTIDLIDLISNSSLSPNLRNKQNVSPLELAIQKNSYDYTSAIIKVGAKINEMSPNGNYPVFYATINDKSESLKALIDNGVNITVTDSFGYTLLHKAAEKDSSELLQLLLDTKKININAKSKTGITPVGYCFMNGYENSGEFLISKGADLYIADSTGTNTAVYRQRYYLRQCETLLQEKNSENKLLSQLQLKKKEHETMCERYKIEEKKSNSELYTIRSTCEDAQLQKDSYYQQMKRYERDRESYLRDYNHYLYLLDLADTAYEEYTYSRKAMDAQTNAERMETSRKIAERSYNSANSTYMTLQSKVSVAKQTHDKWLSDLNKEQTALLNCQSKINDKLTYINGLQEKIDSAKNNANVYPLTK